MVSFLNANQGFVSVLLTFVLVLVTVVYAIAAWRATAAARRANQVAEQAHLGALIVLTEGATDPGTSTVRYTATNIGFAPALNMSASICIDGTWFPGPERLHFEGRATADDARARSQTVIFQLKPDVMPPAPPAGATVRLEYEDPFGRRTQRPITPGPELGADESGPKSAFR